MTTPTTTPWISCGVTPTGNGSGYRIDAAVEIDGSIIRFEIRPDGRALRLYGTDTWREDVSGEILVDIADVLSAAVGIAVASIMRYREPTPAEEGAADAQ